MNHLITDITDILGCDYQKDPVAHELQREGLTSIRDAGRGVIDLPPGSLRTLHDILQKLSGKNGSATTVERVKMRCIGALGLIRRRHSGEISGELGEICNWLFGIACSHVNTSEETVLLVNKRLGYVLFQDRIITIPDFRRSDTQ